MSAAVAAVSLPATAVLAASSISVPTSHSHKSQSNAKNRNSNNGSMPHIYSTVASTLIRPSIAPSASSSSRRAQPSRQSRVNPVSRKSQNLLHSKPGHLYPELVAAHAQGPSSSSSSKFYPGLAAFTDTVDALPQETIRHFTLLREVDAKACGPEQLLRQHIRDALRLPKPAQSSGRDLALDHLRGCEGVMTGEEQPLGTSDHEATRRSRLHQVRMTISDLLLTLDEKIHVISTASEALTKHLIRIDDAYQVVTTEIDGVVRDGNPDHWAYKLPPPRGTLAQRQAQQIAEIAAADAITSRSETRREALARRNAINNNSNHNPPSTLPSTYHHDNDDLSQAEASLPPIQSSTSKRSYGVPRARKDQETHPSNSTNNQAVHSSPAFGVSTPSILQGPLSKKRKTVSSSLLSHVNPAGIFSSSKAATSPRQTAVIAGNSQPTVTSSAVQRKRNNATLNEHSGTARSTSGNVRRRNTIIPSPLLASSPIQSTFKDGGPLGVSAHLSTNVATITNQASAIPNMKVPSARTGRSRPQTAAKGESPTVLPSEDQSAILDRDEGMAYEGRRQARYDDKALAEFGHKQATESVDELTFISPSNNASGGKNFVSEDNAPRNALLVRDSTYKKESAHVTHHKGETDVYSQNQNIPNLPLKRVQNGSRTTQVNGESVADDEADDEDEDADPDDEADEMRYCYCNQVSYGKMVACDGPNCQKEWFHLPCVNLTHMPGPREKWYCNDCVGTSSKPPRLSHQGRA